jgi:integrase
LPSAGFHRFGCTICATGRRRWPPAGVDIKVVQEELGHSTSVLTRDTYTSVSPRLAREAAERTAAAIPRNTSAAS